MAQLADSSIQILDGAVTLTKRNRSSAWQARYKVGYNWIRTTTKEKDLERAKKVAQDMYLRARFRQDEGLPVISKRFDAVARLAKKRMQDALDNKSGKKVFKDYITAIDKYLIPFFGKHNITSINQTLINQFAEWRTLKMKREPKASTINTHNSAINRIFDEAVLQGYMTKSHIPMLQNEGQDSDRRPDFTYEEYKQLIGFMKHWVRDGKKGKSRDMRYLLRDYVLILANTGMRHGTESYGLKWKHLSWEKKGNERVLMLSVDGKTGHRELAARHNCINYFRRIAARDKDLKALTLEKVVELGINEYVFRLPDGTKTENLSQTFRVLMNDSGLMKDRRTGMNRTLYSLRHTYATFALLYHKLPIHDLAVQMGTSEQMIREHYSHLTTRHIATELAGYNFDKAQLEKEELEEDDYEADDSDLQQAS